MNRTITKLLLVGIACLAVPAATQATPGAHIVLGAVQLHDGSWLGIDGGSAPVDEVRGRAWAGTDAYASSSATSNNPKVFRNIEQPETTAAVGHFADPTGILAARCCEGAAIWRNPETVFGGDLAALQLEPAVAFVVSSGLRFVLDIDL